MDDAGVADATTQEVDAFTPDAGPGAPLYTPCFAASECAGLVCAPGPDSTADLGQCSRSCSIHADCPTVGGASGVCVDSTCLRSCAATNECPGAFGCFVDPGTLLHACFEVDDPAWRGDRACGSISNTCTSPSQCVYGGLLGLNGTCVVACTSDGDDCPFDADCLAMPATRTNGPAFGCVARCNSGVDCDNSSCTSFPDTTKHCVPTEWGN